MHALTLPTIALIFSVIALVLTASNTRAQYLARVADCVTVTATAQGYPGNPYSREAWDLFATNCK